MRGERLEVEHLRARARERGKKAALAAAGGTVHDGEVQFGGQRCQRFNYPAPVRAIAAGQRLRLPAHLAQDVRHRAGALAAAPAIDERMPALIFLAEKRVDVPRHVLRDERGAEVLRLEWGHLLVERDEFGALV